MYIYILLLYTVYYSIHSDPDRLLGKLSRTFFIEHVIILNVLGHREHLKDVRNMRNICISLPHFSFAQIFILRFLYCVLTCAQQALIYIEGVLLALSVVSARHPIVFASTENLMCALFIKTMTQIHRIYSEQ